MSATYSPPSCCRTCGERHVKGEPHTCHPDHDVLRAIVATREEWDLMDWRMQQWYRWLIRTSPTP